MRNTAHATTHFGKPITSNPWRTSFSVTSDIIWEAICSLQSKGNIQRDTEASAKLCNVVDDRVTWYPPNPFSILDGTTALCFIKHDSLSISPYVANDSTTEGVYTGTL